MFFCILKVLLSFSDIVKYFQKSKEIKVLHKGTTVTTTVKTETENCIERYLSNANTRVKRNSLN